MMFRLLLLKQYLLGRRNGVHWNEMLKRLLSASSFKRANDRISRIVEKDKWSLVYFRDLPSPLYWPKEMSIRHLYQVIAEIMYPDDWHYYEWGPTPIASDDIVVDCGAAEGLFSLSVSHRCRRVYAIEPLPRFIQALALTFSGIHNVQVIPVALSNNIGEAFLAAKGIASSIVPTSSHNSETTIKVSTIDNLFYEKQIPITYLKADLEGYELKMLEGGRNTIAVYKPKIAITTYHHVGHAKWITDYLREINPNYRITMKGLEQNWGAPIMLHAGMD